MPALPMIDAFTPYACKVVDIRVESRSIFTLDLVFTDPNVHKSYRFQPGQFNMMYMHGLGEVAISIVSDPSDRDVLSHTIRKVGRITNTMGALRIGDEIGIRGPFGRGWPMQEALGKDVVVVTGGLGCAPSVSIIEYIMRRRQDYGHLDILQGVKHSEDFIFQKRYDLWRQSPKTNIFIAADEAGPKWPWSTGYVTSMISKTEFDPSNCIAMMCGPEMMMANAVRSLAEKGMAEENIYLSMERNMECGMGLCGHCQYGGVFICKDGPVFPYPAIKTLYNEKGF